MTDSKAELKRYGFFAIGGEIQETESTIGEHYRCADVDAELASLREKVAEEFHRGAKAVFDWMLFRAANHFHGNPVIQKQFDIENAFLTECVEDALEEISPESHMKWRNIVELGAEKQQLREQLAVAMRLTAKALRDAADFVSCGDDDDEQREVCIVLREAFTSSDGEAMPAGFYCYDPEYPEEGLHGPLGMTPTQGAEGADKP